MVRTTTASEQTQLCRTEKNQYNPWEKTRCGRDSIGGEDRISLMNQYVGCCEEYRLHPIFQHRLQHFLNEPSQHSLILSYSRASTRDVYVLLLALSGGGNRQSSPRRANIMAPTGGRQPQLLALDLSDNRLTADTEFSAMLSLLVVPERAPLLPALRPSSSATASLSELDLSRNRLGATGAAALASLLRGGRLGLRTLVVSRAALHDNGCAAVAAALGPLPALTHLDLSENGAAQARSTRARRQTPIPARWRVRPVQNWHSAAGPATESQRGRARDRVIGIAAEEAALRWSRYAAKQSRAHQCPSPMLSSCPSSPCRPNLNSPPRGAYFLLRRPALSLAETPREGGRGGPALSLAERERKRWGGPALSHMCRGTLQACLGGPGYESNSVRFLPSPSTPLGTTNLKCDRLPHFNQPGYSPCRRGPLSRCQAGMSLSLILGYPAQRATRAMVH